MRGRTSPTAAALMAVVVVSLTLSACGGPDGAAHGSDAARYTGTVPTYSGPWADAFAEAYRATTDPVVHRVLDDEVITDSEFSEVAAKFMSCMADHSVEVVLDDQYGGFSVPSQTTVEDSKVDAALAACSAAFDAISYLRASIVRNPDKLDENEIMAACLVKAGVVDPGYTGEAYFRDQTSGSTPWDPDDGRVRLCGLDPLNGGGDGS